MNLYRVCLISQGRNRLGRIAGVVYPSLFQLEGKIFPMLEIQKKGATSRPFTHSWSQIEMGSIGHPIATNFKEDIFLLFDGELFYEKELLQKLKREGRTSNPTTESLIIEAYEQYGEKFLSHLEGDFALAILDKQKKKLILARDRVGKKPLYWGTDGGYFLFGSELKALLVTGLIPQTPSQDALSTYLAFGYFPQDATPIQKVSKLLPGHYLVLDDLKSPRIQSYWSLSSFCSSPLSMKKEAIQESLHHLIQEAVKERSRGKSGIGNFLSGDVGSGSVGWFLKEGSAEGVSSFTAYFEGENEDEARRANAYASALSSAEEVCKITPKDFLASLPDLLWQVEEPIADPEVVAAWYLAKMPKKGSHIFSGMGSEELLGQHRRYTLEEKRYGKIGSFFNDISLNFKKKMIPLFRAFGSNAAFDLLRSVRSSPLLTQYVDQNLLFQKRSLRQLSPFLSTLFDPIVFLEKFHNLSKIRSPALAFTYLDFKTRLPDLHIEPFERFSAASEFFWQTPFLDQRLIEFAIRIPEPADFREMALGSPLQQMMHAHFPPDVIKENKLPKGSFLSAWAHDPHILSSFSHLRKGSLVEIGLIDRKWIERAVASPELRERHFRHLFALMQLENWFHLFILSPIHESSTSSR